VCSSVKSAASASRVRRSASFSSRWISIRRGSSSRNPSRSSSARARTSPAFREVLAHPAGGFGDLLDVVEVDLVGDLLGEVHDVVQRRRQGEDVLPLDRRDEGLVDEAVDVVGDVVGLVLEIPEPRMP